MKAILFTLAGLCGLIGGTLTAVEVADQRYAPMSEFQDIHWSTLRAQVRELQDRIRAAQSPELKRDLEADLSDLIDLFCRRYPNDRLCK